MVDFASCREDLPVISDADFCEGFRGCGETGGLPLTAANINAVLAAIHATSNNANLDLTIVGTTLSLVDTSTTPDTVIASVTLPGGGGGGSMTGAQILAALEFTSCGSEGPGPALEVGDAIATCRNLEDVENDLQTQIDNLRGDVQANVVRAGTFGVVPNSSGTVAFANPFPFGSVPIVMITPYGNVNGGDEADEPIFVSARDENGFTWQFPNDGNAVTFGYHAVLPF